MKICHVDPACGLAIPPKNWGAIEKIIWEFEENQRKLGHHSTHKLSSFIRPGEYDIVHCHVANLAIGLKNKGIPYVYQLHDHHVKYYGKESATFKENLEAIELLQQVNTRAYLKHPGVMMIAEESTAWPGVSKPVDSGGLGFGFKWNMGWMNDTLKYMERDPIHRQHHHNEMTFGLVYSFSENFVLPLSHDEVVHGKGSLLNKMPGDDWQKFANLRAYYGFMWTHPGKKLLFMGCEFAQRDEWNHDQSLDWHLLQHGSLRGVQTLIKDLNHAYKNIPALYELDCDSSGFEWLDSQNSQQSI